MTTKFNVGDKVFIEGEILGIYTKDTIDGIEIMYSILIKADDRSDLGAKTSCIRFKEQNLTPACYSEEQDMKYKTKIGKDTINEK